MIIIITKKKIHKLLGFGDRKRKPVDLLAQEMEAQVNWIASTARRFNRNAARTYIDRTAKEAKNLL